MRRHIRGFVVFWLLIAVVALLPSIHHTHRIQAQEAAEAILARGEYLMNIAACFACHTPYQAEYNVPPDQWTPEQLQTVALNADDALDHDRAYSGGRPFDLGPGGVVVSANITSDEATGLGSWTDAEIEAALRIGVSKDGTRLHSIMPYRNYYTMAQEDMQALIAYMRTIPPIENKVERTWAPGEGVAPELLPEGELPAAAPTESIALGEYLVNVVMGCADCHTPVDPVTFAPIMDKWLAGGQPYEGPWGIVYAANITPHDETGIGTWTPAQIDAVFRSGVRADGRRLVLMSWQDYVTITQDDLNAVIDYLQNGLAAVENEIPAPAIEEMFIQYVEVPATAQAAPADNTPMIVAGIAIATVVLLGVGILLMRRQKPAQTASSQK